jgi:hypothetical protein
MQGRARQDAQNQKPIQTKLKLAAMADDAGNDRRGEARVGHSWDDGVLQNGGLFIMLVSNHEPIPHIPGT